MLKSELLKSSGAGAWLNRQRKTKTGRRKKEGKREKMDHTREDDAEWAEKNLPLDEAFLDFYIKWVAVDTG